MFRRVLSVWTDVNDLHRTRRAVTSISTTMNEQDLASLRPTLRSPGAGRPADARADAGARAEARHTLESLKELEDGALMELVREGDEAAFELLMRRYKNPLVNYLSKLTRDRDRAEEVAQEAFLRLYQNADRYRDRGFFTAYLYRIATNLVRSEERRKSRWRTISTLFAAEEEKTTVSPHRELASGEVAEVVTAALSQLPMRYRAPIVLREIEGLSYAEIAEALDCREGTVKSRINRAKARLRDLLEGYWQATQDDVSAGEDSLDA